MADSIDFADACNRSSSGISNVREPVALRNLAWDAALLGGRSVSIPGNCQPSVSKVPG